jgi:hypothetical protein
MEDLMQINDCNQLRGFDEAPTAVHFAELDQIDSAVVAAPLSSMTSPAAAPTAAVVPVQFHTATPLAASASSPTKIVLATSLHSSTAMITFSHPLVPVNALEGDVAIDTVGQANMNINQLAALAGDTAQRYVLPHRRALLEPTKRPKSATFSIKVGLMQVLRIRVTRDFVNME